MADLSDLDETTPVDIDLLSVGDDDLRNTKASTRGAFAGLAPGGSVGCSAECMNYMAGATSNIQTQLDADPFIYWKHVFPDRVTGDTDLEYDAVPNVRWLLRRAETTSAIFQVILPAIASSSDGDVFETKGTAEPRADRFFQLATPGLETMRVLNSANVWVNASFTNTSASVSFPHVLAVFSAQYNKWVVRFKSGVVEQTV